MTPAPGPDSLARHRDAFHARFGREGAAPRLFFAPGRVNLFGAHLDYNGGPVMPTAIDRGTFFAARPSSGGRLRLASVQETEVFEGRVDDLPAAPLGRWFDYPLGVVRAARAVEGLDLLFGGDLPIGAGLSSSASICVGTAFVLASLGHLESDPKEWIRLALEAERGFVGVQCGIMDPYAVGLARPGRLLWLDCKDGSYEHVPFDFERVSIGVADTGVRRELAQGEFNKRVGDCRTAFATLAPLCDGLPVTCLRDVPLDVLERWGERLDPIVRQRAQHVLGEVARTFAARDALLRGDAETMGALMLETHASLRELYEVSCPQLDVLVEAAAGAPGAFGARLTGAGFGGCAVVLVRRGSEEAVEEALVRAFEARFGQRPHVAFYGGDEGPREIDGDR